MNKQLSLWALLLVIISAASAQSFKMPTSGRIAISANSGYLYDDGGPFLNYANNGTGRITIYPQTPGQKIILTFDSLDTEGGTDAITVYDGVNINSGLIEQFGGDMSLLPTRAYVATNQWGALTVFFSSNSQTTASGFTAHFNIVPPSAGIDLIAGPASVGDTLIAGATVTADCRITNIGQVATTINSIVGIYLSTDSVLTGADINVGSLTTGLLNAVGSETVLGNIAIPGGTAAGLYYLIFKADNTGLLTEADESNNTYTIAVQVVAPLPDLVIQIASPSQDTYTYSGAGNSIAAMVKNQGFVASNHVSIGIYFSYDSIWDAADIILDSLAAPFTLIPGQFTFIPSNNFTIPVAPYGKYYLLVVADNARLVGEADENNNVYQIPITINPNITDIEATRAVTTTYQVSQGLGGDAWVWFRNKGTLPTGNTIKVGLYISNDTIRNAGDILIDSMTLPSISPGDSESLWFGNFPVPVSVSQGAKYLVFVYNFRNQPTGDADTTNNTAWCPIIVTPYKPDYTVTAEYHDSVWAGESITMYYLINNEGTQNASAIPVGIFLSNDTVFDGNDIFIDSFHTSAIQIRNNYSRLQPVTIPSNTQPGIKYILTIADYTSLVSENFENNNLAYTPLGVVSPRYNMAVDSTSFALSLAPGQNANASYFVYNKGNTGYNNLKVGFYLSHDLALDVSDRLIDSATVTNLLPGVNGIFNKTITIPTGTTGGPTCLIYKPNFNNSVADIDLDDDLGYFVFTVNAPYVEFTSGYLGVIPDTLAPGGTTQLTSYMYNLGTAASPASKVGIYLSTDGVPDGGDILIDTVLFSGISANANYDIIRNITIPANTAFGNYYIIAYIDNDNQVSEPNETNNYSIVPITILNLAPDLQISLSSLSPSSLYAGNTFTANYTIQNAGSSASAAGRIGFYLSTDNTFNTGDILLDSIAFASLGAGANHSAGYTLTMPAGTLPGNYYVIAYVDNNTAIAELNENNNTGVRSIAVTLAPLIDLTLLTGPSSDTIAPASQLSINFSLYNNGSSTSPAGTVGFYLSTDNIFDGSDDYLDNLNFNAINASDSVSLSHAVTIPLSLTYGYYYILAYVDYSNTITETNEANNVDGYYFYCGVPTTLVADLQVGTVTLGQSTVVAGTDVSYNFSTYNVGTANSASTNMAIYLSGNAVYDAGDQQLNSNILPALIAGDSHSFSANITIPVVTSAGNYFLLFYADASGSVAESDESNNIVAKPIVVATGTGIQNQTAGNNISLYPNPATSKLYGHIQTDLPEVASLHIIDVLGKTVITENINLQPGTNSVSINTGQFAAGTYIFRLSTQSGMLYNALFVVAE